MEKDTCHGLGVWFMALRLRVDSSSDWPPDRNMIPGTAGGTLLLSILGVYSAMVSGEHLVPLSAPGATMDGLSRIPSKRTSWSARYLKVWAQVLLATSRVVSMSCSPSSKISGSTMGTSPLSSLIPGTMPCSLRQSTNGFPSLEDW